jgi:hypothetical protein
MLNHPVHDYNKCLAILMLRTAKCTQEATADYLGCGKKKVVAVEKWFRGLHYEDAIEICFDNAIYCALVVELDQKEWLPETQKKLEKLNAISVLLHYCHVEKSMPFPYIPPKDPSAPKLIPLPSTHFARLGIAAEKLRLNIKLVKSTKGAVLIGNITRGYIKTKTKKKYTLQDVDRLDASCLLAHLKVMYSIFQVITNWESLSTVESVAQVSSEMLNNLKKVSHGWALQGTCEICGSWDIDSMRR